MRVALPAVLLAACATPDAPAVSLGPATPDTTQDLVLEVTSVEPLDEGDVLQVTWEVDGSEVSDLADALTVPSDRTAAGESWTAAVSIARGNRVSAVATDEVVIANAAPTVTVTVGPDGARTTDDLVATATAEDIDGDEVTLTYAWDRGGQASSTTGAVLPAAETARDQTWRVVVTATDTAGDTATDEAFITVQNTPPSVALAQVEPASLFTNSTATCRGAGFDDPDDDPEAYEVEWLVNGVSQGISETLGGDAFERGDQVVCRLFPVDDVSRGEPVESAAADVRNSLPLVRGLRIEPAEPTVADSLIAEIDAVLDADGDGAIIRYTWTVDGEEISTSDHVDEFTLVKGDEVTVGARPFDGVENGGLWEASVTIQNSPPTAPVVAVSGSVGDGLLCEIVTDSTDVDDDPLDYTVSWLADGTPFSGATTTTLAGDTIAAGDVGPGERWTCQVVADDGEDSSTAGTDSISL